MLVLFFLLFLVALLPSTQNPCLLTIPSTARLHTPPPLQVFVLTESKEADQREALKRVRELALSRCGVQVEVAPWLDGRLALDTFLDNHRRVLDLIIRHRLACGMW